MTNLTQFHFHLMRAIDFRIIRMVLQELSNGSGLYDLMYKLVPQHPSGNILHWYRKVGDLKLHTVTWKTLACDRIVVSPECLPSFFILFEDAIYQLRVYSHLPVSLASA